MIAELAPEIGETDCINEKKICATNGVHFQAFQFENGRHVSKVRIAYHLTGPENAPVIAVLGGISSDRHMTDQGPVPGWWPEIAGPGKVLDTNQFRLLGIDYLGGQGSSSTVGELGWEMLESPGITTIDQANALHLIIQALGIQSLHGLVGSSYGGMVGLAFASRFPEKVSRLVVISAAHQATPQAVAWRGIQRRIVTMGLQNGCSIQALNLARQLAMLTYRTPEEMNARFEVRAEGQNDRQSITAYLNHCGGKFAARFSPEAFLCLAESIDRHNVAPRGIHVPTDFVAVDSDQLVPLQQMEDLHRELGSRGRLHVLRSRFGHDAFLKEPEAVTQILTDIFYSASWKGVSHD